MITTILIIIIAFFLIIFFFKFEHRRREIVVVLLLIILLIFYSSATTFFKNSGTKISSPKDVASAMSSYTGWAVNSGKVLAKSGKDTVVSLWDIITGKSLDNKE